MALVAGVLAAMVGPRLAGSREHRRLVDAGRLLTGLARQARARAASEGRTHLVVVDGLEGTARLARARDPLAPPSDPEQPELELLEEETGWARPQPLGDGVGLVEAWLDDEAQDPLAPVAVAFDRHGEATSARLVLATAGGDDRLAFVVLPVTGLTTLFDPDREDLGEEAP